MYSNLQKNTNQRAQTGFTLVELMVAITLGLLITAAVIQSYLGTRQTYRVTEGVGRIQENARFGHYFITKDLREAGNSDCLNNIQNKLTGSPDNYLAFNQPVSAWDFAGTNSDNTYTIDLGYPTSGTWSGIGGTLPGFLSDQVVSGSDILWFKSYRKSDIALDSGNTIANTTLNINGTHNVESGSILLVGDCSVSQLFQHIGGTNNLVAAESGGTPGNRTIPNKWNRVYDSRHSVYEVLQTYYYIGLGASGLPSLFRFQTGKPTAAVTNTDFSSQTQELVEGVESLQALFGIDTNGDSNPNRYASANQVTAAQRDAIVSVRVGLLFRSPNNAADEDQAANYTLLDNIRLTHSAEDNIVRYPINSTVKLRNRAINSTLTISDFVCDAPCS